jgi:hypothetical protein
LKPGEFASADVISKSIGIDKTKVKKLMDYLFEDMGFENSVVSIFNKAGIIDANSKEEKIYCANSVYGGLFMAMMILAREITDCPLAFRHIINAKQKSWIDRKKMFDQTS